MQSHSTVLDEAADAADRLDRRNAVIVSLLGLVGVTISGVMLIFDDTVF